MKYTVNCEHYQPCFNESTKERDECKDDFSDGKLGKCLLLNKLTLKGYCDGFCKLKSPYSDKIFKTLQKLGESSNESIDKTTLNKYVDLTKNGIKIENKPFPTVKKAKSAIMALMKGTKIEDQTRIDKRLEICGSCEFVKKTQKGELWCGKCGCSVSSDDRKILNLAVYEENLPIYGCKANGPKGPSKWEENGV